MSEYLGLFVDDDIKNFEAIRRQLALKNISLLPYEELPADIEDIYQRILDKNVDFVIIDYDLGKQAVKYTGIDVLKSIREQRDIKMNYELQKKYLDDRIAMLKRQLEK